MTRKPRAPAAARAAPAQADQVATYVVGDMPVRYRRKTHAVGAELELTAEEAEQLADYVSAKPAESTEPNKE